MEPLRLFESPKAPPTTRTIALTVLRDGPQALDQAQRRADNARYQEVTCRSALNPVKGMPFAWTLNPYRGCTHACHYCFARRYQTQFALGPDDEFSSLIFVKQNFPEVLRRELEKPSWKRELVALGTATDPYQPIEGHYKLTRRSLEALIACRTPVGIVTKGPMIVRDADLLAELTRTAGCTVALSVPTVDEAAWAALEPGTAHPLQRLRAVRTLRKAGVKAGVLMAPDRSGIHDRTRPPRSDNPRGRRARRSVPRFERPPPQGWHEGSLHGIFAPGVSRPRRRLRAAVSRRLRAERVRGDSQGAGERASPAARRQRPHEPRRAG